MRLNSQKQKDLVINNLGLVHYFVRKLSILPSDYEDLVSIGTIGLIKAAATFNESKNILFATYASRCIQNEIFMYLKKENSHSNNVSLNSPISDKDLSLIDVIESEDEAFTDMIENNIIFEKCISIILNFLSPRDKLIMLYRISDISQSDIAEILNLSQSYVSRLIAMLEKKVKSCFLQNMKYMEVFKMKIVENSYLISFSSKNVKEFNKVFTTFLQSLSSAETLPDFKVVCNNQRIILKVPAHPKSFSFIAKIIQQIDNYSFTFTSNNETFSEGNVLFDEVQLSESNIVKPARTVEEAILKNEISKNFETGANFVRTSTQALKKKKKSEQLKDYMLTMTVFTFQDLKEKFNDFSISTIYNALSRVQTEGLIIRTGKQKYSVINRKNT